MGNKNSTLAKKESSNSFGCKEMLHKSVILDIRKEYNLSDCIGKGTYGEVYRAESVRTKRINALKKVQKQEQVNVQRMLSNEFYALRDVDHPNIIKMLEFFEDAKYFYVVTELIDGKELFDSFFAKKKFTEREAFPVFYQMCLALVYLQRKQIMHRDIKLENIIYSEKRQIAKLIDFGSATYYDSAEMQPRSCTGSVSYIAPEVIAKCYNHQCDIWSLGIMLYVLISGNAPFLGPTNDAILKSITNDPLTFKRSVWEPLALLRDLLTRMLHKDPLQRITLQQIFHHDWVTRMKEELSFDAEQHQFTVICLANMLKFKELLIAEIQIGVLVFMVNFVYDLPNKESLMQSFNILDSRADGVVCEQEIISALIEYMDVPPKQATAHAQAIMHKIDFNGNHSLDYSQFIVSASNLREILTTEHIRATFDYIDTDHSGTLSVEEIQAKLGDNLSADSYRKLLKHFDSNGDSEIDLPEFMAMMTGLLAKY